MKKLAMMIAPALLMAACAGKQQETVEGGDADRLYAEMCNLVKAYTDSMSHATDSASVTRITAAFEKRLVEVNAGVRPDTDFNLTENQNDTIYKLIHRYDSIRRRKIHEISFPTPDSLSFNAGSEQIGNPHLEEASATVVHK